MLGLKYVHGNLEDPKTLTHHKLIHAASERVLSDTKSVADENLKDKGRQHHMWCVWHYRNLSPSSMNWPCCHILVDVLLLIKKRPPPTLPKMADISSEEKVILSASYFRFSCKALYLACLKWSICFVCPEIHRRNKKIRLQTKMQFWKPLPTCPRATLTAPLPSITSEM